MIAKSQPFLRVAKHQTMRRDFSNLRTAIRNGDAIAADEAWAQCERWLSQLLPITDRDLLRPGGTTDQQGRGI